MAVQHGGDESLENAGMKAWKTMFTAANSKSRIPPGECNRIHYLFTPQGERS